MPTPILEIAGVRKRYADRDALAGVDLSVAAGELFGLLGPNGAGKTTLMAVLSGLSDPTAGTVRLFGEPFGTADRRRRRLVGIAPQDLAVYPELTARENLHFFGRLYGLGGPDLRGRVNDLLAAVGLTDRADHRAGTFSGGMQRRLNLAVAVVHRPKLLLLDEPTTGVDPQSRNHIFELVKGLNAAGMTVVYTSHYMEEVQTLCERIAILDGGVVKACDTLPNLLRRLDAKARLRYDAVPEGQGGRLGAVPGVKAVRAIPGGFEVTADAIPPVLPGLLTAGGTVTSLDVEPPTLERVFLHLTGHELRD